jgi:CheY-like chemotaxis protein
VSRRRIALAADLIFASRIRAVATELGEAISFARSATDLIEQVRAAPTSSVEVLLDLETRGLDVPVTIGTLRAEGARIVAFVSHVRGDLIAAARSAGAQRVLARSAFVRELPRILAAESATEP